jgi:hypothetical protein
MAYELVAVARTPQLSGPPTLTEVGPIVAPTITWTRELNRAGSIGFSCTPDRLDAAVRARFADLLNNPTEVWLYRNGVRVMAGLVAGYQIQGDTQNVLSVTAPGLLAYLQYMQVDADLTFNGVDQTTIAKTLVDQWQNLDYGNYGIDTSGVTASGVTRDRSYVAAEQHQVYQRLRELGQTVDGFDIDVDADRRLVLSHPSEGADLSQSVVLDGRNITDAGVVVSVAAGDVASEAFGLGGDGVDAITARASNTALRAEFGRAGVAEAFDGVTVPATLAGHTQALLDARSTALFLPGPGLVPVADADVDDFGVGDSVTYEYDAGLGVQSGVFRVSTIRVAVDENGAETMAVGFA